MHLWRDLSEHESLLIDMANWALNDIVRDYQHEIPLRFRHDLELMLLLGWTYAQGLPCRRP